MGASANLIGQTFGRLTVVSREARGVSKRARWHCVCVCGGSALTISSLLIGGETQSCGCLRRERASSAAGLANRTHGKTKTPEYRSWRSMLSRCYNPAATGYARYGGAGISVCDDWKLSFENFHADMGDRPTISHTLDRYPNKFGNYGPGNCRWATPKEQQANRRDTVNGRRIPVEYTEVSV